MPKASKKSPVHSEAQKEQVALARKVLSAMKRKIGGDAALNAQMGHGEAKKVMAEWRARVDAAKP
jgi:hypothetical protein